MCHTAQSYQIIHCHTGWKKVKGGGIIIILAQLFPT